MRYAYCVCGHTIEKHLYEEGACHPGYVCECAQFKLETDKLKLTPGNILASETQAGVFVKSSTYNKLRTKNEQLEAQAAAYRQSIKEIEAALRDPEDSYPRNAHGISLGALENNQAGQALLDELTELRALVKTEADEVRESFNAVLGADKMYRGKLDALRERAALAEMNRDNYACENRQLCDDKRELRERVAKLEAVRDAARKFKTSFDKGFQNSASALHARDEIFEALAALDSDDSEKEKS